MVNKCATKKSNKTLFLVSCKPQMWKIWSPYNYQNTQHPYKIEFSTTHVRHPIFFFIHMHHHSFQVMGINGGKQGHKHVLKVLLKLGELFRSLCTIKKGEDISPILVASLLCILYPCQHYMQTPYSRRKGLAKRNYMNTKLPLHNPWKHYYNSENIP